MNDHTSVNRSPSNARSRQSREIRLDETWAVIRRHAGLIRSTTLIVVALAIAYVVLVRPQFAATSEVMLDPRKSSVENTAAVLSNLPADQPTILNQIEILTSHRFAGKVVDQLHLASDPEFATPGLSARIFASEVDPRETAIDQLHKRLKVAQAGFSSSIRISVTAGDRQKASLISSSIAGIYVAEQLDTKSAASRQATLWLTQRVSELALQVKSAEAAVQKYKADHNITITSDGTSILEKQVADLNSQLAVARTDYDDKASKANRTDALIKTDQLASAPQVVASPLITTLREQEAATNRDIANLATRYGPNHPKIKELQAQRADTAAKISQEASRIAESVRNEAESSRAHVNSLEKGIREIEDQSARKNQEAVELTALQSAAASARALYQAFLTQYSQTENQQGILRPDAFVISASEVSETFGPQTKLLAVLSAIPAGLLLGLAFAFMAERGTIGQPREPQSDGLWDIAPRPAAVLPEAGARAADLVVSNPQSPFAVAVSRLLSEILAGTRHPATIVVTEMEAGSGKTTLALALARAATRSGIRAIVIDANGPNRHLSTMVGSVAGWPAFAAQQVSLETFINPDPLSGALVMAADRHMTGYDSALAPAMLARLVANLKSSIDLVVIAAPAIGECFAPPIFAMGDVVLIAKDARRPALMPNFGRGVLTILTHVR